MPLEPERDEPLVGTSQKVVVAPGGAERSQRERLEDRRLLEQDRHLVLDELAPPKRHERVQSGGHGSHAPDVRSLDGYLDQLLGSRAVRTCEGQAQHRPGQVRLKSFARNSHGVSFELHRSCLVTQDEMRDPAEQEIARVSHTGRREVLRDEIPDPTCLRREPGPVAERVRQLQLE